MNPGTINSNPIPRTNQSENFEKLKIEIADKIKRAEANPLTSKELEEIERQIKFQKDKFLASGTRTPEDIAKDEEIKRRVLGSSAVVSTIPEYEEMLRQIAKKHEISNREAWVRDTLAHENAHANTAQSLEYEMDGYAGIFIGDEQKKVVGFQPLHIHTSPNEWKPVELLTKEITVLEAPDKYENQMSDSDKAEKDEAVRQLEFLRQKDAKETRNRLSDVNSQLGI